MTTFDCHCGWDGPDRAAAAAHWSETGHDPMRAGALLSELPPDREAVARAISDVPEFWNPLVYHGWDTLHAEDREWALTLADAAIAALATGGEGGK